MTDYQCQITPCRTKYVTAALLLTQNNETRRPCQVVSKIILRGGEGVGRGGGNDPLHMLRIAPVHLHLSGDASQKALRVIQKHFAVFPNEP